MVRLHLPLCYIQRSICEVETHLQEKMEAEGTLDSAAPLGVTAEQMALQFREYFISSKWYRRIPSLIWCFLPIPICLFVCFAWYVTGLTLLSHFWFPDRFPTESEGGFLVEWFFYSSRIATPMIAAFLLLKFVKQSGKSRILKRIVVATLALAFLMTLIDFQYSTSATDGYIVLIFQVDQLSDLSIGNVIEAAVVVAICMTEFIRDSFNYSSKIAVVSSIS